MIAKMKPYQLLGLSFLVYLHQNGLSGILGDEMGLGKTLQTLSLIQFLKENRKSTNSGQLRPSLVVCPLSVLNSWMAESRKWTPDLKVRLTIISASTCLLFLPVKVFARMSCCLRFP